MMKTRSMIKYLLLWLFLSNATKVSAQKNFKYSAQVQQVYADGFYKIKLQPEVLAKCKNDLADLRITDQHGNFVPFVTGADLPAIDQKFFITFPQISLADNHDTTTTFVVANNSAAPIHTLWVRLKNTVVRRTVNLLGSDNLHQWFAIQEDIPLENAQAVNSLNTYLQSLSFPSSSYHYYKIVVNDKNKAAVKIMAAGVFLEKVIPQQISEVLAYRFTKKDSSNKITYVQVWFKEAFPINKIRIALTGPKYFKRSLVIYGGDNKAVFLNEDELISGKPTDFYVAGTFKHLELQIANNDDLPLQITGVSALMVNKLVVAQLKAKQKYTLLFADEKAIAPRYDLKYFADSIGNVLPELNHGRVVINGGFAVQKTESPKNFTILIWIAMVIAIIVLLLLTYKMAREINLKKGS